MKMKFDITFWANMAVVYFGALTGVGISSHGFIGLSFPIIATIAGLLCNWVMNKI